MKRAIAILLLVVCFALPIISVVAETFYHCTICGGEHAVGGHRYGVTSRGDTPYHNIVEIIYTHCLECGGDADKYVLKVGLEKHTKKKGSEGTSYYHVSPHLTIVYDVCECGQRFNPREVYSY